MMAGDSDEKSFEWLMRVTTIQYASNSYFVARLNQTRLPLSSLGPGVPSTICIEAKAWVLRLVWCTGGHFTCGSNRVEIAGRQVLISKTGATSRRPCGVPLLSVSQLYEERVGIE